MYVWLRKKDKSVYITFSYLRRIPIYDSIKPIHKYKVGPSEYQSPVLHVQILC